MIRHIKQQRYSTCIISICIHFHCCHNKPPHTQWLKTMQIYCLTVGGQKSNMGLSMRCWQNCVPFWSPSGRICFLGHLGCWPNPVPCRAQTGSPFSCWLWAEGHSQLPGAPGLVTPSFIFKARNGRMSPSHTFLTNPSAFLFCSE